MADPAYGGWLEPKERRFRVVWCPHPNCTRFTVGEFTATEVVEILKHHASDCDGVRHKKRLPMVEAKMRIDGRWTRVLRRWGIGQDPLQEASHG